MNNEKLGLHSVEVCSCSIGAGSLGKQNPHCTSLNTEASLSSLCDLNCSRRARRCDHTEVKLRLVHCVQVGLRKKKRTKTVSSHPGRQKDPPPPREKLLAYHHNDTLPIQYTLSPLRFPLLCSIRWSYFPSIQHLTLAQNSSICLRIVPPPLN